MPGEKMVVEVVVLVTDCGAEVLEDESNHKERLADALSYGGAAAAELRLIRFEVELLAAPRPQKVDATSLTLEVAGDIKEMVDKVNEAKRLREWYAASDMLMHLDPGVYEVEHTPTGRSMKRLK